MRLEDIFLGYITPYLSLLRYKFNPIIQMYIIELNLSNFKNQIIIKKTFLLFKGKCVIQIIQHVIQQL